MDFTQGKFAKVHDFCMDFDCMSDRLHSLSKKYPSDLIMPIIESDLSTPALAKMISEINCCNYLVTDSRYDAQYPRKLREDAFES